MYYSKIVRVASAILARNPRNVAIWALAAAAIFGPVQSRGDIQVARGALTLQAITEIQYDSNIFADSRQVRDGLLVVTPSGEFLRQAGLLEVNAKAGLRAEQFFDHTSQNVADPFGELDLKLARSETKIEGFADTTLRRSEEADPLVNARAKYDEFQFNTGWGYYPVEKIGYRLDGLFNERDYRVAGMSDIRTKALGSNLEYQYQEKLWFFGGIGGRWVTTYHVPTTLVASDSDDFKVKLGAQGDVLSKVTGRLAFGWVHRHFQTAQGGSRQGLLFETALNWKVDEETSVNLTVSRDFDTTPIDQSVMQLLTAIDVRRELREKIVVTGGIGHTHSNFIGNFTNRRDDAVLVRAGVEYSFTRRITAALNGSLDVTNSNWAVSDYSRLIVAASVKTIF